MFISRAHHEEVVRLMQQQIADLVVTRDALMAQYHALKLDGAAVPVKPADAPKSPLVAIGPKTYAALREMSVGLPNTVRRSMEASALALHASGLQDAEVAAAVRAGEQHNGNGR